MFGLSKGTELKKGSNYGYSTLLQRYTTILQSTLHHNQSSGIRVPGKLLIKKNPKYPLRGRGGVGCYATLHQ